MSTTFLALLSLAGLSYLAMGQEPPIPNQVSFRQVISNDPVNYANENTVWIWTPGSIAAAGYVDKYCYSNGTGDGCYLQGTGSITVGDYSQSSSCIYHCFQLSRLPIAWELTQSTAIHHPSAYFGPCNYVNEPLSVTTHFGNGTSKTVDFFGTCSYGSGESGEFCSSPPGVCDTYWIEFLPIRH
jgi:hypothetical protein